MTEANTLLVVAAIAGPLVAGMASFFAAKANSKPSADTALTARFEAYISRQEQERVRMVDDYAAKMKKLETVTADLESMVIQFMEWADEVVIVTERRGVKIPDRPKFHHHVI